MSRAAAIACVLLNLGFLAGGIGAGCLGAGCIGHERFAGAEGEPLHSDPPTISDIRWDCSSTDATWSFEVDTVNWTANGALWLVVDTDYVEQHAVRSTSAAQDGSWDQLALSLDIVADWRDASSGSSTAFFCNPPTTETISFRLVVYTPGSEEAADCRSWGAQPTLLDRVDGVPACELLWEEPDTASMP